jgi:tetratricopeptide (TPR) repeat protein
MNDTAQVILPRRIGVSLVASVIFFVVSAGLLSMLDKERNAYARAQELAYLPKGEYLRWVVFGYRELMADFIWLQAVQHIGASRDTALGYTWTYHAVDVVTDLDPRFIAPYHAAGIFLGVLVGRHEEGIAILEKGMRNNPEVWQLPFLAGYISYYEQCNPVLAGKYLQQAAEVPGSPTYLARLAARMTVQSGDPAAALEFLERFSRGVQDVRVREALAIRIKEIVQDRDLRTLEEAVRHYRDRVGRFPSKLDDLLLRGFVLKLPTDPLGGEYQIDPLTGSVNTSSRQERLRIHNQNMCRLQRSKPTERAVSGEAT